MLRRSSGCFVGHDVGVRVIKCSTRPIVLCFVCDGCGYCADVFWCTLDAPPTRNALDKNQYLWFFNIIIIMFDGSELLA